MDEGPRSRAAGLVPYLFILAAFAVSRIVYYAAGVRFQTGLVRFNVQFIDVELMKHRLAESLFYYHTYPPLHNLVVGLVVKAFPEDYGAALHILQMALGVVSAVLLFQLMRYLAVPAWLACAITILFITSPGCVLFENFPMYEYLILALLLAQCVSLYGLVKRPNFWRAFLFFSLLAALALVRAFYHLYYLLAVAIALGLFLRPRARTIAAAAALPILAVFALYAKNLVIFGFFGASSWLGNNLPTVTTHHLTAEECQSLVLSGKLDAFGCVEGSSPPATYRAYVPVLKATGIPVLDQEMKSTGDANFNNQIYLKTGPMFARAAKQVLRNYPVAYLRSVLIAWFAYFRPPSDFFQFEDNRAAIRGFERVYNLLLFGQLRQASNKELRNLRASGGALSLVLYTGALLIIAIPTILLATAFFWMRDWLGETERASRLVLIAFIVIQIVLVAAISNFLSSFENNRYRFPTDPLYLTLAGVLLTRMIRRFRVDQRRR